jgi:hypothetical protein
LQALILYSTVGCHLCELAKEQIDPLLSHFSLYVQEIDIADSELLLEKYGVRIPLITFENYVGELAWPFDTEAAYAFYQRFIAEQSLVAPLS